MSKEIFEALKEDELRARLDIPYHIYKDLKDQWEYAEEVEYRGAYHPQHNKLYSQNKEWETLNRIRKYITEEMKEIESKIRVDGEVTD